MPGRGGRRFAALLCGRVEDVELREGAHPLDFTIWGPDEKGRMAALPIYSPLFTPLDPEAEAPFGVSLLRSLPFLTDILMKIYHTIGVNWERCGNVRFAVTCRNGENASERSRQLAQEWSRAMAETRSGSVRDFVAVGDVDIRVIGGLLATCRPGGARALVVVAGVAPLDVVPGPAREACCCPSRWTMTCGAALLVLALVAAGTSCGLILAPGAAGGDAVPGAQAVAAACRNRPGGCGWKMTGWRRSGEHHEQELAQINALAKTKLTAEQVYTFTLRLCDNEVDRDLERFDGPALERLGELFVGKSGVFDHQWSARGTVCRLDPE